MIQELLPLIGVEEVVYIGETATTYLSPIQERVWLDEDSCSNTVDVHIGVLRKKIDQGHAEKLIHTVRGAGYVLRRDGAEAHTALLRH